MLTIRFSRTGKKKKPFYRIIISEKKKSPTSSYLELLGHYDPRTKKAVLKIDRVKHWIERGSTLSNSIFNLFVKEGVIESADKRRSVFISQKRQSKIDEQKGKREPEKIESTAGEKAVPDEVGAHTKGQDVEPASSGAGAPSDAARAGKEKSVPKEDGQKETPAES